MFPEPLIRIKQAGFDPIACVNGQASWAYETWDNAGSRAEGARAQWFFPYAALRLPVNKVREEQYFKTCSGDMLPAC